MNYNICTHIKDLLPDFIRDKVSSEYSLRVRSHLDTCTDCNDEFLILQKIQVATPIPPVDLAAKIKISVANDRRQTYWSLTWQFSFAAAVIIALGTTFIWQRTQNFPDTNQLIQESVLISWPMDDVGGGIPMFKDLSEDELITLLEELDG